MEVCRASRYQDFSPSKRLNPSIFCTRQRSRRAGLQLMPWTTWVGDRHKPAMIFMSFSLVMSSSPEGLFL